MILIDSFPYDLMLKGELKLESEITEHEVEEGGSFVDHIRTKPIEFVFEAIVSNSPIGEIATDPTRVGLEVQAVAQATGAAVFNILGAAFGASIEANPAPLPSAEAHERLITIWREKKIVTIEIPVASRNKKPGKRTFTNMALQSLSEPYGADSDGGYRFTATFKQIRIIQNARIVKRTSVPRGQSKGNNSKATVGEPLKVFSTIEWHLAEPPGTHLLPRHAVMTIELIWSDGKGGPGAQVLHRVDLSKSNPGAFRFPPAYFLDGAVISGNYLNALGKRSLAADLGRDREARDAKKLKGYVGTSAQSTAVVGASSTELELEKFKRKTAAEDKKTIHRVARDLGFEDDDEL